MTFDEFIKDLSIPLRSLETTPENPGVYLLFSDWGQLIYVGKAQNLKSRLKEHFSPQEDNEIIRTLARRFIYEVTVDVATAELQEGELYDIFLETFKHPPIGNKIAPPKSKHSSKMVLLELYKKHPELFRIFRSQQQQQ